MSNPTDTTTLTVAVTRDRVLFVDRTTPVPVTAYHVTATGPARGLIWVEVPGRDPVVIEAASYQPMIAELFGQ